MLTVFLNGRIMTGDEALREARVSALDAGLTHGVGLFETMLAGHGAGDGGAWVMHLDEHLERLADSAVMLGLAASLHAGPLGEAVIKTVERSALPRARVRLTLTGGDLNLLAAARQAADGRGGGAAESTPTVLIVAQPAAPTPTEMLERGVLVTLAQTRPSNAAPFAGHKTLDYWWRLHELRAAGAKGAQEALVFDTAGHLCGGCVSNAFVVRGGELHTPTARGDGPAEESSGPTRSPAVLPGVTRRWAMQSAASRGVLTRTRGVRIDDVLEAEEAFLTSSIWGVLPVTRVEGRTIGDGGVGPITRDLMRSFAREVDETAALA